MRAAILDDLIDGFAPALSASGVPASYWIGSRYVEIDRFYVA